MHRSLLTAAVSLCLTASVTAEVSLDQAAHLMRTFCPGLVQALGDQNVERAITSYQHRAPGRPGGGDDWGDPGGWGGWGDDSTRLKYQEDMRCFMDEVLPLYDFRFNNRQRPATVRDFDRQWEPAKVVFHTPADGCFYGVGDPRNTYDPYGIDCEECEATGGQLKHNGAYAWGMATDGEKLYWSTNNNYMCMPGYDGSLHPTGDGGAFANRCLACEFEMGPRGQEVAGYGDVAVPRIFTYDPKTGVVEDITPSTDDFPELLDCQGLRSAHYFNGMVFFGGPSITGGTAATGKGASCFLAYSVKQHKFVASSDMASVDGNTVTNVRRWAVIDNVLYCGVGITTPTGESRGAVLRWTGDESHPFDFHVVGYVGGQAAEICEHRGRIYIATWGGTGEQACVYRSPVIPQGGFSTDNPPYWEKVWAYAQYDPNAASGSWAGVCSYKGRLYMGTFCYGYACLASAMRHYDSLFTPQALAYVLGSFRACTVWSSEDFNDASDLQLVYGDNEIWNFGRRPDQDASDTSKHWYKSVNPGGYEAQFGPSGFGNPYTCYTWAMNVYGNRLYMGTMDWSDIGEPGLEDMVADLAPEQYQYVLAAAKDLLHMDADEMGYECLVMDDPDEEPEYVTTDGFGNHDAYGIRNIINLGDHMYIGTASPLNLAPKGGWEIVALKDRKVSAIDDIAAQPREAGIVYNVMDGGIDMAAIDPAVRITSVTLYDYTGAVVAAQSPNVQRTYLDTSMAAPGVYPVQAVLSDGRVTSFKAVIR